jgi:mRNA turnover protein 4
VCRAGQTLDPNQAALLRVFGIKMATFRLTPMAWWSSDGEQQQQQQLAYLPAALAIDAQ